MSEGPGRVEAVYVAPAGKAPPQAVERVRAVPGHGLEGDRYSNGTGTFFQAGKDGQDLTLIEAEALEGLHAETGIALAPADARRNVVTRGIGLNDLVGRRFAVGEVVCRGARLCDPCRPLERMTQRGVLKGLAGRGGLRADVLEGGDIAPGDVVRALPPDVE
jgi:MOSC domain-containing protein YiiM